MQSGATHLHQLYDKVQSALPIISQEVKGSSGLGSTGSYNLSCVQGRDDRPPRSVARCSRLPSQLTYERVDVDVKKWGKGCVDVRT